MEQVPDRHLEPPLGYMDAEWPIRDEWEEFYFYDECDEYDDDEDEV